MCRTLRQINARTARSQTSCGPHVGAGPRAADPVMALVVAGMNDVLNSQGYTQAA